MCSNSMQNIDSINARVEHQNGQVEESKGNGKWAKEIIDKYDLRILNFQPETEGKWTRIQQKGKVECKSEIDYVITDANTRNCVQKTIIDEEKIFTSYRIKKQGKKKSLIFSDHCAIMTSLNIQKGKNKRKNPTEKLKRWVITEEGLD